MSQNLGAGLLYMLTCGCCCPGGQDPYTGTRGCWCCLRDRNVHAREKEVDSHFLERDYRRDASGHIHMQPSPSRTMTRDRTGSK
ncbi:hypothetical protein BD626DRAFT_517335, partial [Schizophyllum amplum]